MATNILFHEVTPMFPARFNSWCELQGCHEATYTDITEMMGVEIFSPETQDFERKYNDKPYWICANHYMEAGENNPNQEEELEEEILEMLEEEEEVAVAEVADEEWEDQQIGYYRDITSIFLARFDGKCQLEGCDEDFQADI